MKKQELRAGFSMITAIFVIVIMATLAAFVMNLSGKIVKSTTMQYQREQAHLYAKSYTEYAVMAVTAHDRDADGCLEEINGDVGTPSTGNGYQARIHISYIGSSDALGSCASVRLNTNDINTTDTPLTIIIDTYVDYKEIDNENNKWLTVHRRSVQKI